MCNCHSYNWDDPESGKDAGETLNPKDYIGFDGDVKSVSVDSCISHVIKHLWGNNIWTLNSCCGHNKLTASIIFDSGLSVEDADNIRRVIAEVDGREFEILSWKLCKL